MYATGVSAIDAEHEQLVALTNRLFAAARVPDGAVSARTAAERLMAAAASHFAHEERLMEEAGYHCAARHKAAHAALLAALARIAARLASGPAWHGQTMALFADDCLFRHVHREDKPFAAFLGRRRPR